MITEEGQVSWFLSELFSYFICPFFIPLWKQLQNPNCPNIVLNPKGFVYDDIPMICVPTLSYPFIVKWTPLHPSCGPILLQGSPSWVRTGLSIIIHCMSLYIEFHTNHRLSIHLCPRVLVHINLYYVYTCWQTSHIILHTHLVLKSEPLLRYEYGSQSRYGDF